MVLGRQGELRKNLWLCTEKQSQMLSSLRPNDCWLVVEEVWFPLFTIRLATERHLFYWISLILLDVRRSAPRTYHVLQCSRGGGKDSLEREKILGRCVWRLKT